MKNRDSELEAARRARAVAESRATEDLAAASAVRAALSRRAPQIESTMQFLAARQRRNGFGADLSLTLVPRRPRP